VTPTPDSRFRRRRISAAVIAAGLVLAACGSGDDGDAGSTDTAAVETPPPADDSTADTSQPGTDSPDGTTAESSEAPAAERGEELVVANDTKPNSLNPTLTNSHPNQWSHMSLAYEPLVHLNTDLSISPGLAESWEFSNENKTVTFTLREGLKFADGTPLTATEAVASINYWIENSAQATTFAPSITSVTAADDRTIVVEQSQANPSILRVFSENFFGGSLISPAGLADPAQLEEATFGAGPYVLDNDASVAGSSYVYVPSENFYDPSMQHFNRVVVKIIPGGAPQLQALQAGEVDLITLDGSTNAEAEGLGVPISQGAPAAVFGVVLADRDGEVNEAIANPDVRRALMMAVDRAPVCNATFGTAAVPTGNFPAIDAQDPANDEVNAYDAEGARELLATAGYPDGFDLRFEMSASPPIFSTLGQAVAGYWDDLGVNVEITTSPGISDSQTAQTNKEFETYIYGFGMLPAHLVANAFLDSNSPGPFNPWGTQNAEIADLLASAPALAEDESIAEYQEAFAIALDEGWVLNLCELQNAFAASDDITGWQIEDALLPPWVTMIEPA